MHCKSHNVARTFNTYQVLSRLHKLTCFQVRFAGSDRLRLHLTIPITYSTLSRRVYHKRWLSDKVSSIEIKLFNLNIFYSVVIATKYIFDINKSLSQWTEVKFGTVAVARKHQSDLDHAPYCRYP